MRLWCAGLGLLLALVPAVGAQPFPPDTTFPVPVRRKVQVANTQPVARPAPTGPTVLRPGDTCFIAPPGTVTVVRHEGAWVRVRYHTTAPVRGSACAAEGVVEYLVSPQDLAAYPAEAEAASQRAREEAVRAKMSRDRPRPHPPRGGFDAGN